MKKRFIGVTFFIMMMFVICFSSTSNNVYAKTYTKKMVNNKIKSLKSEIAKINTQYKSEKEKEKKETAGYKAFVGTRLSVYDPYYLQEFLSNSYYYVKNPEALSGVAMVSGYIKLTGGTVTGYDRYDNPVTCNVAVAKKFSTKSLSTKKKLDKKKKELSSYKNALRQKISVVDKKTLYLSPKDSYKLEEDEEYELKYDDTINKKSINKIKWKSSNTSVVKIDQNGKITALKTGKATITAKLSISNKSTKFIIEVWPTVEQYNFETPEISLNSYTTELKFYANPIGSYTDLDMSESEEEYNDNVSVTKVSTGNIVQYCYVNLMDPGDEYDYYIIKAEFASDAQSGDYVLTVRDNSYNATGSCIIHFTNPDPSKEYNGDDGEGPNV